MSEKVVPFAVVVHCNLCGAGKSWDAGDSKEPRRGVALAEAESWKEVHAALHRIGGVKQ